MLLILTNSVILTMNICVTTRSLGTQFRPFATNVCDTKCFKQCIEHTCAKMLVNALERQVSCGDTNGEVIDC